MPRLLFSIRIESRHSTVLDSSQSDCIALSLIVWCSFGFEAGMFVVRPIESGDCGILCFFTCLESARKIRALVRRSKK